MTAIVIDMEKLFMQRYLQRMLSATDMPGFLSWLETYRLAERLSPGIVGNWIPEAGIADWDAAADQIHAEIYSALATPANDPIPTA